MHEHYEIINGIFKCRLCQREIRKQRYLRKHLKNKHKMGAIQCEYCHKLFASNYMGIHKLTHTNEKKHCCEKCGESFARPHNLLRHKRIHLLPEERNKLKKHICEICGSSFIYKCKLKIHMECHNEEKTFRCEICGTSYRASKTLATHKRTIHKQGKGCHQN